MEMCLDRLTHADAAHFQPSEAERVFLFIAVFSDPQKDMLYVCYVSAFYHWCRG